MKSPRRFKATRREALAGWTEAIAQDPNNVEAHHNRGVFYFREKNYAAAIQDLSRVMELDPSYGDAQRFLLQAYLKRGLAYFAKGDDARAIGDFTDALKRDPDDFTVSFCRSMAYRRAEDSRCRAANNLSTARDS